MILNLVFIENGLQDFVVLYVFVFMSSIEFDFGDGGLFSNINKDGSEYENKVPPAQQRKS